VTWDNAELASWVEGDALRSRLHLLGRREDIADLMPALDILVSSSAGEAFSNVIGEAMACGVPCAVTDVGDSAFIVGESGQIVPPGDALALANACQILLDLPPERREQLGQAARQRVQTDFGLPVVCARFEALYREVLA
jgi:glycosyltransferase involved in cell wall biosynthesis